MGVGGERSNNSISGSNEKGEEGLAGGVKRERLEKEKVRCMVLYVCLRWVNQQFLSVQCEMTNVGAGGEALVDRFGLDRRERQKVLGRVDFDMMFGKLHERLLLR